MKPTVSTTLRGWVCILGILLGANDGMPQSHALTGPKPVPAQGSDAAASRPDPAILDLHVYANLEQVPVLVLSPDRERIRHLDSSRFRISLDSGPAFRPTYVRQEGDDPLSLAVLVDTTHLTDELLPGFSQAFSALVPQYLHPQDQISIYGLDCGLIRTLHDKSGDATELKASIDRALQDWQLRRQQEHPAAPCKQAMPLWDSMARVLANLQDQPGRRVLLAVTDGQDNGSRAQWTAVLKLAQVESVAVFALTTIPSLRMKRESEFGEPLIMHSPLLIAQEDELNLICESSGGVEFQANPRVESWRLKDFTQMLRERYILEYPRGRNRQAGVHSLEVSLGMSGLYIRPSGISAPVASEDERKGPHTVPTNSSLAPKEGKRKILPSSQ